MTLAEVKALLGQLTSVELDALIEAVKAGDETFRLRWTLSELESEVNRLKEVNKVLAKMCANLARDSQVKKD
jgi:hypothetical protein